MRFVGILLVFLSIPIFISMLKAYPQQRNWAYFLFGILPLTMSALNLDAALISWPTWTGYAKGHVISLLDTLAIAMIAVSARPWQRLPLMFAFLAYIFAVLLSMLFSELAMSTSFYVFQLARMFILFVAVASFAGKPSAVRWMALGLACGAIFQGVLTVDQRLSGVVQASGSVGHQNLLGMMLHFVTLPLLALLLGGDRRKIIILGVLAALLAVALGASRGTIGFIGAGIPLLLLLSLLRRITVHKWKIVAIVLVAALAISPIVLKSFAERFAVNPNTAGSNEEREAFERAASSILSDHPMGIGANQYVVVANSAGYNDRAGVIPTYASRSAKVHNIYLLIGAETGWLGIVSFAFLLGLAIFRGLKFCFQNRKDPRGEIVLGMTVAIMVSAAHSFFEWILITYNAQYLLAIALGIIGGTIRQVEREKSMQLRMKRRKIAAVSGSSGEPEPQFG